ncbi:aromatic acid/H+ symport family MFS transporter [Paenarthrobacter nitroguajacolicus]|uniref:MFS transporter n=1 Tax=Paenarthrobacter nitroguajacolicus TaxID=211146 RepID=UPI002862ABB1|nr:aromatic acid/H+ symport family MFS transporter [Paenarthrobacter nitroguajacolicus]MDR6639546.1 AAHS family benzoate transporter-like MFS transporter [Paenarthrobacter nitroguajacolicus]
MTQPLSDQQRLLAVPRRNGRSVLLLCFATIVFDGYDLVVFGSTVPTILKYEQWAVSPAQAGLIGSLALVGMLIGTLSVGVLTDRVGRRKIMLASISWFSLCMLLTALAPTVEAFAALRFLTGLGLGGVVPTCIALTVEYARKDRRQIANAVMFSGYSVGGVLASLLAINLLPHMDFRWMYAIGALPLVTLLPVVWKFMPESVAHLARKGRFQESEAVAAQYGLVYSDIVTSEDKTGGATTQNSSIRTIFTRKWRLSTILFALANFCGLLLVYGLNTWLPQIMRQAGFNLGDALSFLLVLNAGAIVGSISASVVADRIGIKRVVITSFALACIAILMLSLQLPLALLLVIVAFAGLGSVGTQILVAGYCATHYPQSLSATALSWSLGVGRIGAITGPIIGGFIVSLALGWQVNFYMFAAFAVIGALVIFAVPRGSGKVESPGRDEPARRGTV